MIDQLMSHPGDSFKYNFSHMAHYIEVCVG